MSLIDCGEVAPPDSGEAVIGNQGQQQRSKFSPPEQPPFDAPNEEDGQVE